jgi:hypothetical protein
MMGCIALLLAPIPYIAFFKGPWIRERSPYSRILMAEEKKRVELEAGLMDEKVADVEMQRQRDNEAEVGSELVEEGEEFEREENEHERARNEKGGKEGRLPRSKLGQREWSSDDTLSDHRS